MKDLFIFNILFVIIYYKIIRYIIIDDQMLMINYEEK